MRGNLSDFCRKGDLDTLMKIATEQNAGFAIEFCCRFSHEDCVSWLVQKFGNKSNVIWSQIESTATPKMMLALLNDHPLPDILMRAVYRKHKESAFILIRSGLKVRWTREEDVWALDYQIECDKERASATVAFIYMLRTNKVPKDLTRHFAKQFHAQWYVPIKNN